MALYTTLYLTLLLYLTVCWTLVISSNGMKPLPLWVMPGFMIIHLVGGLSILALTIGVTAFMVYMLCGIASILAGGIW